MSLRDDRSTACESWRDLVARIRAGDEAAFEAMFRAYYDPLCRHVAPYLGSRDAAEDAVQGLFVRIWEDRARWVVSDLGHYLYTAVRGPAARPRRDRRRGSRTAGRGIRCRRVVAPPRAGPGHAGTAYSCRVCV